MANVYLVSEGEYDDFRIIGAFSSLKKAKAYLNEKELDRLRKQNPDAIGISTDGNWLWDDKWDYGIEAHSLDKLTTPLRWRAKQTNHQDDREGKSGDVIMIYPSSLRRKDF